MFLPERRVDASLMVCNLGWCCNPSTVGQTRALICADTHLEHRRLISKVRNVLEAQIPLPQSRVVGVAVPTSTDNTITIRTDPRQFESFLRSINRCSSLLDARRLKNDIMGEIRRTRTLLG